MSNRSIRFEPVTRDNWEAAMKLAVLPEQRRFAPSPAESLAVAYIKPWDEALDPYVIYAGDDLVGMVYLSYTPESSDNYWIGGFIIDHRYQGRGLGKAAFAAMLKFFPGLHSKCDMLRLTVEKDNAVAQRLYQSMGFTDTGELNRDGEIIYTMPVAKP